MEDFFETKLARRLEIRPRPARAGDDLTALISKQAHGFRAADVDAKDVHRVDSSAPAPGGRFAGFS
jgi:hypothetical protein